MVSQIITLVNQALTTIGELAITETEFDNGTQSHHNVCRESVNNFIYKMYRVRKDSVLRITQSFQTIIGQASYRILTDLDNLLEKLVYIAADPRDDRYLIYKPEHNVDQEYVNQDRITKTGSPVEYWINSDSSGGYIRINPIPDDVYTIRYYRYAEPSRVRATDLTVCSFVGDKAIQTYLAARLANELQKGNESTLIRESEEVWNDYLCENDNTNNLTNCMLPVIHAHTNDYY